MEILWNQVNLQRPPFRSWDVSINEFNPRQFIHVIDKILEDFKTLKLLHSEAALLSRLIYRMKSKFRNDKGLKYMEKVNRGLLNYLKMSIEREYELLKEYVEIDNGVVSVPSQQSLEYVLVKTQGFAKLMSRVESSAMTAGHILQSRFHTGQSWSVAIIAYGVISRIWILSREIIKKACEWYKSIHYFTKLFKSVGIPWLPEDFNLPLDLSKWLELTWLSEDVKKLPAKIDLGKSIFNLIKGQEVVEINNSDEPELTFEKISTDHQKPKQKHNDHKINDFGKFVSRDDFEKTNKDLVKKQEIDKKQKIKKKIKPLMIHTEKDLVHLLKANSYPEFNQLQWDKFKKRLKKLLMKLTKNNTCGLNEKKLKKINCKINTWTQNCVNVNNNK